jgi:tRNA uridine 5-carboxymethylaminomethyl modification enzyme
MLDLSLIMNRIISNSRIIGNEIVRACFAYRASRKFCMIPYLAREQRDIERTNQYKTLKLQPATEYIGLPGLSRELLEKLQRYNPENIAQAALIPGMTPAALSLLILKTRAR